MSENIAVAVYCILAVANLAIAEADTLRRWLAILKRAMSKNRSGKRKMVKTGEEAGKPNQFALGFFLGALITILVSLITWGSAPTPKRLALGLGLLFLCGIYPAWCAANAVGAAFRIKRSAVVAIRCIALIILAGATGLLGKDLWPPLPLIAMQLNPSSFPVSIPPHSAVSILQIHPYIGLTDSNDGLLKDTNDTGTEYFWPSQGEIESKEQNAHEGVYRIEIANHSPHTADKRKGVLPVTICPRSL